MNKYIKDLQISITDDIIEVDKVQFKNGDTYDFELIEFLCLLGKNKNVFELGTYRGRTTHNIALNAKEVYTFDYGSNLSPGGYDDYIVGEVYKSKGHTNITQLIGDSLTFDFSPYYGMFDLVYLDAGHTEEYVKNDWELSKKLIKPSGCIVVDDASWPDVIKFFAPLEDNNIVRKMYEIYYYENK